MINMDVNTIKEDASLDVNNVKSSLPVGFVMML